MIKLPIELLDLLFLFPKKKFIFNLIFINFSIINKILERYLLFYQYPIIKDKHKNDYYLK